MSSTSSTIEERAAPQAVVGAYRPGARRRVGPFNVLGFSSLLGKELLRLRKMVMLLVVAPALSAALYFTVFAFGLGDQRGTPQGDALLLGLAPGLVMLSVLMQAATAPAFSLLIAKMEGSMIDALMAPLGAAEIVGAFVVSGALAGLMSGAAVWLGFVVFCQTSLALPGAAVLFAVLGAVLMGTVGTLAGLASAKWDHLSAIMTFVLLPLTYMSGLFAPVGRLTGWAGWLAHLNPLFHVVDGVRAGFLGLTPPGDWGVPDLAVDFWVLVGVDGVLLALALALVGRGWRLRN